MRSRSLPTTLTAPDTEVDARVGASAVLAPTEASIRQPALPSETPVPAERASRRRFGGMFDSLSHSGFRWYFAAMMGQMASMNMQMLVRGYLVYEITGSYADLGVASLAGAAPMLLLSLHGGVLADRVKVKKHIVTAAQIVSMLAALAIGLLIALNRLTFDALLVAAVVQGIVQALMNPARQSLIPELVGMKRLMNAVALNSAGMNSMRLFAPALGGLLLAIISPAWVYFIMAGWYAWAFLLMLKVPGEPDPTFVAERAAAEARKPRGTDAGMREGIRYIMHDPTLRTVLGVNVLLILTSMPYVFLLPGFVSSVLHAGPDKLGLLLSLTGAGSLVGALVIAALPPRRRGLLFLVSALFQGIALTAFAASSWLWVTAGIMVFVGIGQAGRQSFSNVLVQAYSDDEHHGRVMSVYMLQFGLTAFGTFLVGVLAAAIGAQVALGGTSIAMVVISLAAIAFSRRMRELA